MRHITISLPVVPVMKCVVLVWCVLLLGNAAALVLVHRLDIGDAWGLVTLFHFDREQNLPTLYSVLLLLGGSMLAFFHARNDGLVEIDRSGWVLIAAILLFLAIDEFASIHERVDAALHYYIESGFLPYAAWPLPYAAAAALAGWRLLPWLVRQNRRLILALLVAGSVYVSGAAGVELIAGEYIATIDPDRSGVVDLKRDLLATVEESLEMMGLMLMFWALACSASDNREH
ncbi:hypothetical protein [Maricaulis sp.]|uniref:hypothetical protein n=1 Tax=unclassified Maricaulis TaxID=2632371 RepID=UPI001B22F349|nr:hypothetical protein [Maricaulis sp.]MBO6798544.1 hypothetical protein [Maricaulis sp.]